MNWKIALVVALLTGLVTAAVTAPVAIALMELHGVTTMEGAQGYALAFLFLPAGLIGGFLVGLLATRMMHASQWRHFWKALGTSVAIGQVGLFCIAGLSFAGLPQPPWSDGLPLAVEFEVRLPEAAVPPENLGPGGIRLSLYAGRDDNSYARIDTARYRRESGHLIVPAMADLNSRRASRMVYFYVGTHTQLELNPLPLPATPGEADMEWTTFVPLREAKFGGGTSAITDAQVRYRVVKQPE